MTTLVGHGAARAQFDAALRGGALHHAWLLAGPEGVGKATFAREAAVRLLGGEGARALADAGTHPDLRVLSRLPKDPEQPGQDLARSITVAQVRALGPVFAATPSLGGRRVVVIDAADDLERAGANALLKNLEEPPAGTVFLLVAHAPGRLLATVKSRCRLLRFEALGQVETETVLARHLPEAGEGELAALARAGEGSPGRALRFAGLDVAGLDAALTRIAASGDPDNAERVKLSAALSGKAAQARYAAFLERAPAAIAAAARTRRGDALAAALDAYARARDLAGAAAGLSLDPQGTVFEMTGLVARLASRD